MASTVLGRVVIDERGRDLAEVEDLLFEADGGVARILLSVGGVMDVGGKVVAVPWKPLGFTRWAVTYKDLDRKQLEEMEPYGR